MAVAALRQDASCCARCDRIAGLLRGYADLMSLRDWETQVAHGEPQDTDAIAEAEMAVGRRVVRVRVSERWDHLEPDEQRHALCHELVHPHARDLMEAVLDGARHEFGGAAFRVYAASVEREHERMVDALATAISPVLPLP